MQAEGVSRETDGFAWDSLPTKLPIRAKGTTVRDHAAAVKNAATLRVPTSEKLTKQAFVATATGTLKRDFSTWTEKRPGSKQDQTFGSCDPAMRSVVRPRRQDIHYPVKVLNTSKFDADFAFTHTK
jgi:hypothetical protein